MEEAPSIYFKMREVFRGRTKRWAKQDNAAQNKKKIKSRVVDQSMATCINHKKKVCRQQVIQ